MLLLPIGAKAIFEGQARFSQMQYLYLSSGTLLDLETFDREGMLEGVYIEAFDAFLKITGLSWPSTLDDSIIGLFLLVCDISINPVEGIVDTLLEYERLIEVHDPGARFVRLCAAIKENTNVFLSGISNYSAEEYWSVSDAICKATGIVSPRHLSDTVAAWPSVSNDINKLLAEDAKFQFSPENLPVRLFLARFVRFHQDKKVHPEFFCWPGAWMTALRNEGLSPDKALLLFEEHRALFLDREDGDVYPRTFDNRDEGSVQETFDAFYSWVAIYELTRQWMVGSGNFNLGFSWLTSKYAVSEVEEWASSNFKKAFGVSINEFRIVAPNA